MVKILILLQREENEFCGPMFRIAVYFFRTHCDLGNDGEPLKDNHFKKSVISSDNIYRYLTYFLTSFDHL